MYLLNILVSKCSKYIALYEDTYTYIQHGIKGETYTDKMAVISVGVHSLKAIWDATYNHSLHVPGSRHMSSLSDKWG